MTEYGFTGTLEVKNIAVEGSVKLQNNEVLVQLTMKTRKAWIILNLILWPNLGG